MDWYLENSDAYYSGVPTKEFALVMDFKGIQLFGDGTEKVTACIRNSTQIKHWKCTRFLEVTPCYTFDLFG